MSFLNFPQQLGLAKPCLKAGLELLCADRKVAFEFQSTAQATTRWRFVLADYWYEIGIVLILSPKIHTQEICLSQHRNHLFTQAPYASIAEVCMRNGSIGSW